MLTLDEVKKYLRVDGEDEDVTIEFLIEYSKEEIENSTGVTFDSGGDKKIYQLAQLIIINDRFENRGSQDLEFKANNILSGLYTKLKYGGIDEEPSEQFK